MDKPTIFFSHSSKDQEAITIINHLLKDKVDNSINIFQSSDGESIPFGRNWVYKIEEGLNNSKLMFVFISPNSVNSKWLYFESGYAYSKGIKVIPIGVFGFGLDQASSPLNLLQGFNITSEEGLNNIISIINDEFNKTIELDFEKKDFENFIRSQSDNWGLIKCGIVQFRLVINNSYENIFEDIQSILSFEQTQFSVKELSLEFPGIRIVKERDFISFVIDIDFSERSLPILQDLFQNLQSGADLSLKCHIEFKPHIFIMTETYKILSRIENTEIKFDSLVNEYQFTDIHFYIEKKFRDIIESQNGKRVITQFFIMNLTLSFPDFNLDKIFELLMLLFNYEIISFS